MPRQVLSLTQGPLLRSRSGVGPRPRALTPSPACRFWGADPSTEPEAPGSLAPLGRCLYTRRAGFSPQKGPLRTGSHSRPTEPGHHRVEDEDSQTQTDQERYEARR